MEAETIRVIMTVMAAPFLVINFAHDGQVHHVEKAAVLAWPALVLLVPVAGLGGFLLSRTAFPNGWFMGPLIACALVGIAGLLEGRVPDLLLTIAQIVTGCSLGAQFRREFLTKLVGMVAASAVPIVPVLVVMAAAAIGLGLALKLPVAALALAFAPAGMAEMTLTGKVL